MLHSFNKLLKGYQRFREKYASHEDSFMSNLAEQGQQPDCMVVACCDSRVDPALLLQCHPGELFVIRNVANIIPPFEMDGGHHGTSAALEFGICYLHVKHLIILGHSQCGGVRAKLNHIELHQDDFISRWMDLIKINEEDSHDVDSYAQEALINSYKNCLTFPWVKERLEQNALTIHLWFFNIKDGAIYTYNFSHNAFEPLNK